MTSAIDIRGLKRRLGGKAVLRDLDLRVEVGAGVALLGANGAGKTTLLRIVAGLDRPDAEHAEALGSALPADAQLRSRIGYAAHEPSLYSDLSGAENLAFHARLYGRSEADVDAALDTVEMTHARERPVRELSRGMVQRLSLARALVHQPELLVLDEPSTALDESGRRAVAEIARRARARGATVLAATHDFEFAASIAERACVLTRGHVEWVGDSDATDAGRLRDAYTRIVAGGA